MSYEEQLKFKERKVKNHLLRIGKFKEDEIHMLPIMGMKAVSYTHLKRLWQAVFKAPVPLPCTTRTLGRWAR